MYYLKERDFRGFGGLIEKPQKSYKIIRSKINVLTAQNWLPKNWESDLFPERVPHLSTAPPLITFQFEALVVSLSDITIKHYTLGS